MDKLGTTIVLIVVFLCALAAPIGIRVVKASGPIYIRADGTLDPHDAPIQRNGNLYTLADNITSTTDGIIIEKSYITFDGSGRTIQGGLTGSAFYLYGAGNVTVKNVRTRGFNYGVYVESTSGNTIQANDIAGCAYDGISLYNAAQNVISFNRIENNVWSGVGLYYSSVNRVTGNHIAGNYFGVSLLGSELNSIFHNTFVGNTNDASSDDLPNSWNNAYPSGGNYWSGYTGTDVYSGPNQNQPGSDGIGDTPYNCTGNSQDRYPLMQPWINLAVVNVMPSKTSVGQGYRVNISVTVQNQGWQPQTTNVTIYANATILTIFANKNLAARSELTLASEWQTGSFVRGNYIITAKVDRAPSEPDSTDNTHAYDRKVVVTIAGDTNGDSSVDIYDAIVLAGAFNSVPSSPTWNANADINGDNAVDIYDAILLASNFNKTA